MTLAGRSFLPLLFDTSPQPSLAGKHAGRCLVPASGAHFVDRTVRSEEVQLTVAPESFAMTVDDKVRERFEKLVAIPALGVLVAARDDDLSGLFALRRLVARDRCLNSKVSVLGISRARRDVA